MRTVNNFTSPNFSNEFIPVQFVVLHYTAVDLKTTLEIFGDRTRQTCAHFVLDVDGTVYDLGGFLNGPVRRGAHAGESYVEIDGERFKSLNANSIGIEIINHNGNLFRYADAQYEALIQLLRHLVKRFPELSRPGRVLGHEHIAGYRGKCDPGRAFDWDRVLAGAHLPAHALHAQFACTDEDVTFAQALADRELRPDSKFWARLSTELETRIRSRAT